jgi:hypothetical protein
MRAAVLPRAGRKRVVFSSPLLPLVFFLPAAAGSARVQLLPTFAVLRRGLIGDMTVPDPEALRRGVDTDGAIKQAMCAFRANVTRLLGARWPNAYNSVSFRRRFAFLHFCLSRAHPKRFLFMHSWIWFITFLTLINIPYRSIMEKALSIKYARLTNRTF